MTISVQAKIIVSKWRIVCTAGGLLLSLGLLAGCMQKPSTGPLAAYYYMPDSLEAGKVFHYVSTGDTALSDEFRYLKPEAPGLVRAVIYDAGGRALQWYEESFLPSGVVMNALYLSSGTGNSKAEIIQDDIFPFEAQKNGIFLYRVKWKGAGADSLRYELVRNRIFQGDTTVSYRGKELPAIVFRVRDLIETEQQGLLSLESDGIEIYGLHTGLIYYRKKINKEKELSYRLETVTKPEKIKGIKFNSPWE